MKMNKGEVKENTDNIVTRVACTPTATRTSVLHRGTQPSQLKSCRLHTLQLTKIVLNSSQITDQLQPVRASYK